MPDYEPDEREQAVLDVVKRERRVNPMRVREVTDIRKQYVNDALKQLTKAQYIRKVNRGLYEYAGDQGINIEAARSRSSRRFELPSAPTTASFASSSKPPARRSNDGR